MKKITLIISIFIFISTISFGQNLSERFGKINKVQSLSHQFDKSLKGRTAKGTVCDTTMPTSWLTQACVDSVTDYCFDYVAPLDSGVITGQNIYKFQAFGVKYKGVSGATVSNVFVFYSYKVGTTGNTSCKIFASNSGVPTGTALGTSATITKANIDTTNYGFNFNNKYTFTTPVSVSSDFVVTISVPASFTYNTNELGIYQQNASCSSLDTAGSFEVGSKWYAFSDATNGFGENFDAAIFPVICATTTNVENYTPTDIISLYPNPSNNIVNILSSNNIENIKVINTIGQTVFEKNIGSNYTQINTSDFNSGIYFIQVKCKNGITTKSLQVIK